LSVREHISGTTRAIFTNFSVHVAYGRGSVFVRGMITKSQGEGAIVGVVRVIQKHWRSSLQRLPLPRSLKRDHQIVM